MLRRVCLAVRPCARACAPAYEGLGGSQGPKGFKINVSEASGAAIRPVDVDKPAPFATINAPKASEINVCEGSGAPICPVEVEIPAALVAIIRATVCVLRVPPCVQACVHAYGPGPRRSFAPMARIVVRGVHDTMCLARITPCAGRTTRVKMERVWPQSCRAAGVCCAGVPLFLLRRVCLVKRCCARGVAPACAPVCCACGRWIARGRPGSRARVRKSCMIRCVWAILCRYDRATRVMIERVWPRYCPRRVCARTRA